MAHWHERNNPHRPADQPGTRLQPNLPRQTYASHNQGRFVNPAWTRPDLSENVNSPADSSSSESDLHPSRPKRPSHNRSMSHPFPSLFSGGGNKKKARQPSQGAHWDSDSDGDGPMLQQKKSATQGHSRKGVSKDFATGNCMTCGSLVRWPRELHVFKCTICLTINDLRPVNLDARKSGAPPSTGQATGRERSGSIKAPISLEYTKTIIIDSLRSYLRAALGDTNRGKTQSTINPGATAISYTPSRSRNAPGPIVLPSRPRNPAPSPGASPSLQVPNSAGLFDSPQHRSGRYLSTSYPERSPILPDARSRQTAQAGNCPRSPGPDMASKQIFKEVESYIIHCITSFQCANSSFSTQSSTFGPKPAMPAEPAPAPPSITPLDRVRRPSMPQSDVGKGANGHYYVPELDPKLLLLGNFAENGSWWTGPQDGRRAAQVTAPRHQDAGSSSNAMKSPHIDWATLDEWYAVVVDTGRSWLQVYHEIVHEDFSLAATDTQLYELDAEILAGQDHVRRALLKATENALKRPGRPISEPHELRFLLILAENPLLHSSDRLFQGVYAHPELLQDAERDVTKGSGPISGKHSGIIKRILGLMSNSPNECRAHLEVWFGKYPHAKFARFKDLVAAFLNYRLIRENDKEHEVKVDVTDGFIPVITSGHSPASFHAALEQSAGTARPSGANVKKQKEAPRKTVYQENWQIKAAARVMSLLFEANTAAATRKASSSLLEYDSGTKERVHARGQALATSDFYVTLLDNSDLVADFEAWEQKRAKFSFCQFPFLLSVGAKIQILEHDAKRQMQTKARDAFFDSIMTNRQVDQHLIMRVRRDCLVEDSLKTVSEVDVTGDIKKGLRVIFTGEEGVDAGGLRKEWFLLLIREVFNPDYGMFIYDEDSQYCYFNPNSFETSERFRLVGVVFGLAIYNSTILDVAFPPFVFRKLLRAAPATTATSTQTRSAMQYTLDDLAEFRPRLAKGLRDLLEYDGDVESTFCLNFTVGLDRYGASETVALCPGGENRPVTNANRRDFVDLYVRYLLDTAVTRQFEPFKRGFFNVCGGNALSLFRPEEIELLVRGSDEALDIRSLQVAAQYENWGVANPVAQEPTVVWFWDSFEKASPQDQRKLLSFITGSDRIPAMGAASLTIRVSCLGDDCGRYPLARTCFNMLSLWRHRSRQRFETTLWRAVKESEGFGLK